MDTDNSRQDMQEILLKQRTILVVGEINDKMSGEVISSLVKLQSQSNKPINIIIDSGGGKNQAALRICDVLSYFITAPTRGIALARCQSAATFIMLHCKEKLSLPHAEFLIHSGRISGLSIRLDEATADNLQLLMEETRSSTEQIINMYVEKLQKDESEVKKLIERGDKGFNSELSAKEALAIGLVDKIVTEPLDIFLPTPE